MLAEIQLLIMFKKNWRRKQIESGGGGGAKIIKNLDEQLKVGGGRGLSPPPSCDVNATHLFVFFHICILNL